MYLTLFLNALVSYAWRRLITALGAWLWQLMVSLNRRSDDSFRRAELFAVLNDILKDRFKVSTQWFCQYAGDCKLSIRGLARTYHAPQVDLASPQKVVLVELMRVSDT